jgi:maltose alpha-D-glucosyltransferase/alpha-amylase
MKRMIALRRRHPVFGRGELTMLHPDNAKVLAFVRHDHHEQVLVVANLSRHPQPCALDLSAWAGLTPVELTDGTPFPPVTEADYPLTLGPYECFWFSLQPQPEQLRPSGPAAAGTGEQALVTLPVTGPWPAVLHPSLRRQLAQALATHVEQRRNGTPAAKVRSLDVSDVIDLGPGALVMARVDRADGSSATEVIALAAAPPDDAHALADPSAVIARLPANHHRARDRLLVDATRVPAFASRLLAVVSRAESVPGEQGVLRGRPEAPLARHAVRRGPRRAEALTPSYVRSGRSHASVRFADAFIAKLELQLGAGERPEVTLARSVADAPVPELAGCLEYREHDGGAPRTLLLVQRLVPGAVDAWVAALDELTRFTERVLAEPPRAMSPAAGRHRSPIALAGRVPQSASDLLGPFGVTLEHVGRRLAQLHRVLATLDDPAADGLESPLSALERRSLYQSLRTSTRQGLRVARRHARSAPEPLRQRLVALVAAEAALLERLAPLRSAAFDVVVARTHGNLHLGQVLLSGGDATFVDLADDTASARQARRRPPVRDVAGLLISLEHATAHTLRRQVGRGVVDPEAPAHRMLAAWLAAWSRWAGALVVRGWTSEPGAEAFGTDRPDHLAALLDAFVIERATHELTDALAGRPDWVEVPLETLERLAGRPKPPSSARRRSTDRR